MKLRAHAKVNLGLRVTGRRADGYHDIDTLMVSVDLHDVVEVGDGEPALVVTGPEAAGVPTDGTNLAARAASGARVRIAIEKNVPSGAGLGGASADAAAVLHALGRGDDVDAALALGADVPFCLTGGAACARGVGDLLEPRPVPSSLWLVLVVLPTRLVTADVYAEWDGGGPGEVAEVDVPGVGRVANDLTGPAFRLAPELAASAIALERRTGRPWFMTGSGTGLLLPAPDADAAGEIAHRVGGRVLRPIDRGIAVI